MNRRDFLLSTAGLTLGPGMACGQDKIADAKGREQPDPGFETTPRADSWLKGLLDFTLQNADLPNLYAAVIFDGKPLAKAAIGVRRIDRAIKARPTDRVMIGSVSKAFTATLLAKQVDNAAITWGRRVADVFPQSVPTMSPEYCEVSVSMLLDHSACIGRVNENAVPNHDPVAFRKEVSRQMLMTKPLGTVGKEARYSSGALVAAAMLEKLKGRSYEQMLVEDVSRPLHLTSVSFGPVDSDVGDEEPRGHTRDGQGNLILKDVKINPYIKADPSGGLAMNILDLANFSRSHFLGHASRPNLLTAHTLAFMQYPRFAQFKNGSGGGQSCPWGWANWGYNLSHSGSTGRGDNTFLYLIPSKGLAIALASTLDPQEFKNGDSLGDLVNRILNGLRQILGRDKPLADVRLYTQQDVEAMRDAAN